jgi:hypothetical protein
VSAPSGPGRSVRFEIPDLAAAARLTRRLGGRWHVSLREGLNVNLVAAVIRSAVPGDLAVLLGRVEAWVEEEALYAIRYAVDQREYVLVAGEADWSAFTAPSPSSSPLWPSVIKDTRPGDAERPSRAR